MLLIKAHWRKKMGKGQKGAHSFQSSYLYSFYHSGVGDSVSFSKAFARELRLMQCPYSQLEPMISPHIPLARAHARTRAHPSPLNAFEPLEFPSPFPHTKCNNSNAAIYSGHCNLEKSQEAFENHPLMSNSCHSCRCSSAGPPRKRWPLHFKVTMLLQL